MSKVKKEYPLKTLEIIKNECLILQGKQSLKDIACYGLKDMQELFSNIYFKINSIINKEFEFKHIMNRRVLKNFATMLNQYIRHPQYHTIYDLFKMWMITSDGLLKVIEEEDYNLWIQMM